MCLKSRIKAIGETPQRQRYNPGILFAGDSSVTTVYSPAALLIIALSVLLVLVILLTVASFCVYVATGRALFSFGKRTAKEAPELFALQELWRQSYWS